MLAHFRLNKLRQFSPRLFLSGSSIARQFAIEYRTANNSIEPQHTRVEGIGGSNARWAGGREMAGRASPLAYGSKSNVRFCIRLWKRDVVIHLAQA